jgi:hypothetical protein
MMAVTSNRVPLQEDSASLPNSGCTEQLWVLHIRRRMDRPMYIEGQAPVSIEQESRDGGTPGASPSGVSIDKEIRA